MNAYAERQIVCAHPHDLKGFLQDSCPPNSVYTPAAMNSTGGITPGSCAPPPSSGPSVPISE
jgi:hypothetical protein